MSLPLLYWMLECRVCGTRWVVQDYAQEMVPQAGRVVAPGSGWGGRPLVGRHPCPRGCPLDPKEIGCTFSAEDVADPTLRKEWQKLIARPG